MLPELPGTHTGRVAYILKRYPRLSETFIVNEILGLERSGTEVRIFAAARPREDRIHEMVRRVRAPVIYTGGTGKEDPRELLVSHRKLTAAFPTRYEKLFHRAMDGDGETFAEFAQAGRIAAICLEERVGHLHAHFATSAARTAALISGLTGIPFSFTAHAKDIFLHSVDRDRLRDLLDRAAFVVAISDYHQRFLQSLQPKARVEVVRNGIDPGCFPRRNGAATAHSSLRILAAGRLVEKKGFDDLIRACAVLRERGVPFDCRIVGEGTCRGELEKLIGDLDLADDCHLTGAKTQEELGDLLATSSVFVVPCVQTPSGDRDGLPTVILEAMAVGVPVVATPITAIPEIIRDGETGRLVPERDPRALAGTIAEIGVDHRTADRMVEAARRAVKKVHDATRNSARLGSLFREVGRCVSI